MIRRFVMFVAVTATLVAATASPASALSSSIDPMWMTNGTLYAQTQVGDLMYAGGKNVTLLQTKTGKASVAVTDLVAFNVTTGEGVTSFHPVISHTTDVPSIRALVPSPDGTKLYIGGHFDSVDGVAAKNIARLDLATGTIDTSFKASIVSTGTVYALLVSGDGSRIYIGGAFGKVDNV